MGRTLPGVVSLGQASGAALRKGQIVFVLEPQSYLSYCPSYSEDFGLANSGDAPGLRWEHQSSLGMSHLIWG